MAEPIRPSLSRSEHEHEDLLANEMIATAYALRNDGTRNEVTVLVHRAQDAEPDDAAHAWETVYHALDRTPELIHYLEQPKDEFSWALFLSRTEAIFGPDAEAVLHAGHRTVLLTELQQRLSSHDAHIRSRTMKGMMGDYNYKTKVVDIPSAAESEGHVVDEMLALWKQYSVAVDTAKQSDAYLFDSRVLDAMKLKYGSRIRERMASEQEEGAVPEQRTA